MAPGTLGESLSGYEIHVGHTTSSSPWLRLRNASEESDPSKINPSKLDGARSDDGRVWGCYVHGLFHNDRFRSAWLRSLGVAISESRSPNANESIFRSLDRLTDAFETHIDMTLLEKIIWSQELATTHVG
jgi:adenosylcobyric acid synthase